MARLVNKQFNTPIGLYSQQNIQEVLERETQMLSNGAVGIDFTNPNVGASHFKNSAVLRMLEEEENRQRNGYGSGSDRILKPHRAWPPPDYEQKNQLKSSFKDVVTPGVKRVAWPPPLETEQSGTHPEGSAVQAAPRYQPQAANYQNNNQQPKPTTPNQPSHQQQRGLLKLDVSQSDSPSLSSPLSNQSPQGYRAPTPIKGWAPVHSPVNVPNQPSWRQSSPAKFQGAHQPVSQQTHLGQQYVGASQYQPALNQHQNSLSRYQDPDSQYKTTSKFSANSSQTENFEQYRQSQKYQSEQSYQSSPQSVPRYSEAQSVPIQIQRQQSKPVEPPPSTITLRPQAPVSQAAPPVFTSQPATATLKVKINPKNLRGDLKWPPEDVKQKMYEEAENLNTSNSFLSIQGGKNLRGDLKWPPENVKVQAEEENRLRLELARGPVCRPRKVNKDYTDFFQQHALNSTYPGYKIPPGTQFYRGA